MLERLGLVYAGKRDEVAEGRGKDMGKDKGGEREGWAD